MEFSLARTLEGHCDIADVPHPNFTSTPANDQVNPGVGQIVNLYQTFVPMSGHSLHTHEKKVANAFEENQKNDELKTQIGGGKKLDTPIFNSFQHPILTDSIVFAPPTKNVEKRKNEEEPKASKTKKKKLDNASHKFSVI